MTRDEVDWADRDEAGEYLLEVALELAWVVREDGPAAFQRTVQAKVPSGEWLALITVFASLVPDDRTPTQLLSWTAALGDVTPYTELHQRYQELRRLGWTNADMPHSVISGEQLWQAARARQLQGAS